MHIYMYVQYTFGQNGQYVYIWMICILGIHICMCVYKTSEFPAVLFFNMYIGHTCVCVYIYVYASVCVTT